MNSYILHFRAWAIALAIIACFEAAIFAVVSPGWFDRTNFLIYAFGRAEPMQRLFVFHKLRAFAESEPTIVQSGDSSGFYGIEPSVVMEHLPKNVSYLNMSCCANLGFRGYYNIFDFMAKHNSSIRYMVLHITPYTMPRPEMWDADGANIWGTPGLEVFGNAIRGEFISPRIVMHPPSLAYRQQMTSNLYYLAPLLRLLRPSNDVPSTDYQKTADGDHSVDFLRTSENSEVYLQFLREFRGSRGWMPENDVRAGVYASECDVPTPDFFDLKTLSPKTYLEEVFNAFAALAKQHGATLVIVFQPVACVFGTGGPSAQARDIVDQFKRKHPEVEIPFPLIETWPAEMFSVPAHVRREFADKIGHRLGAAMSEILSKREGRHAIK